MKKILTKIRKKYGEGRRESCGVIEYGKIYGEVLADFREHLICLWCRNHWLSMERKFGIEIPFGKILKGFNPKDYD